MEGKAVGMWGEGRDDIGVPFWVLLMMAFLGLVVFVFMWLGATGQQDVLIESLLSLIRL